jgi:hypothetical protein
MDTDLRQGRLNILVGILGLLLAALGGTILGLTFDKFAVKDGNHVLSMTRFYLREGHSHGMPISLFNLILGTFLDRWFVSIRLKKICSWAAVAAMILPIGLAAKGAAGAPSDFPPLGIIGVFGLITCLVCLLLGYRRISK